MKLVKKKKEKKKKKERTNIMINMHLITYQILLDLFCQLYIYIYTIDKRDLEEFGTHLKDE